MRLFDSILDVNARRVAGERDAVVPAAELASSLPLAALTCIDARLNRLLPEMLGLADGYFIWSRNAGNVIGGPLSSPMRSLALACAVKGAKEIALIGHTDCHIGQTTTLRLLERFAALGIDRARLPANLVEFFGAFSSERENVLRGVDLIRASPLIGPQVPVHGLLIDIQTGRLEWIANGYAPPPTALPGNAGEVFAPARQTLDRFEKIGQFAAAELKLPDTKIGAGIATAREWMNHAEAFAAAIGSPLPGYSAVAPLPPRPTEPPPVSRQTPVQRADEARYRTQTIRAAAPPKP